MAERGLEMAVTRGPRLDRRRGAGDRAGRSGAEDPADGLEHARRRARRTRCSTASRPATDGLHAYFVHSYHLVPARRDDVVAETDYGGPVTAIVAKRQRRRHAVPPREEPEARPGADRQFPEVDALALASPNIF